MHLYFLHIKVPIVNYRNCSSSFHEALSLCYARRSSCRDPAMVMTSQAARAAPVASPLLSLYRIFPAPPLSLISFSFSLSLSPSLTHTLSLSLFLTHPFLLSGETIFTLLPFILFFSASYSTSPLFLPFTHSFFLSQVGLALLALSFYVRPYLQRHHLVTGQKVNSDLFPYGLIAASAATLISRSEWHRANPSLREREREREPPAFASLPLAGPASRSRIDDAGGAAAQSKQLKSNQIPKLSAFN